MEDKGRGLILSVARGQGVILGLGEDVDDGGVSVLVPHQKQNGARNKFRF